MPYAPKWEKRERERERDEVTGGRRKLHNKEQDLRLSQRGL
jgi:hypothetical protein